MFGREADGRSVGTVACTLIWLAVSWCAAAQEMSSEDFTLRRGSFSSAGSTDLRGVNNETTRLGGATIGPSAPIGVSGSREGEVFIAGGFWIPTGGAISVDTCIGDCNADGRVAINELVLGVNIALQNAAIEQCRALDLSNDGRVAINELVAAVVNALNGCDSPAAGAASGMPGRSDPIPLGAQGKVYDGAAPSPATSIDLDLSIWTQPIGGEQVYREQHASTRLLNGVFNVRLGGGTDQTGTLGPATLSSQELWVELEIDGEVLAPRQRMAAVGYALQAQEAERALVAETVIGVPQESEVVSTAGGTFTGPVSLAGPNGATNVSLGSVPGQPEHGMVSVNNASGAAAARLMVDAEGRGQVMVSDGEGQSLVEIGPGSGYDPEAEAEGQTSGLFSSTGSVVNVLGPNGEINAGISYIRSEPDHGFVFAANTTGLPRASMFVNELGNGELNLRNPGGTARVRAAGTGRLSTFGPSGNRNTALDTLSGNPDYGFIAAYGPDGNALANLFVKPNVGGQLRLEDIGRITRVDASGDGVMRTYGPSGALNTYIGQLAESAERGVVAAANSAGSVRSELSVSNEGAGAVLVRGADGGTNVVIGNLAASPNLGQVTVWDEQNQLRANLGASFDDPQAVNVDVRDRNQRRRAQMTDNGIVEAFGPNGNRNTVMSSTTTPDHGLIGVADADGSVRVLVLVDSAGQGGIKAADADGNIRVDLSVLETGAGLIETLGPGGSSNVTLSNLSSDPDQGFIAVSNSDNTSVVGLFANQAGNGVLQTTDATGAARTRVEVETSGQGSIKTFGPNGSQNLRVSSPVGSPNNGSLVVLNDAGNVRGVIEVLPVGAGLVSTQGPNGSDNVRLTAVVGTENHGLVSVHDAGGTAQAIMLVDPQGQGRVIADVKNFAVDHPNRPGHKIVYASLEGPEAAMYYRGVATLENGHGTIELPEHFAALAVPDTVSVQLTPKSFDSLGVAVDEIGSDRIDITELFDGSGSYDVHFLVHAVRRGYEGYQPVISDEEFEAMCAGAEFVPSAPGEITDNTGV